MLDHLIDPNPEPFDEPADEDCVCEGYDVLDEEDYESMDCEERFDRALLRMEKR